MQTHTSAFVRMASLNYGIKAKAKNTYSGLQYLIQCETSLPASRVVLLLVGLVPGFEKLLCRLENLHDVLNDDCDRRKGKRQGQIENRFTDLKIQYGEPYANPDRITPFAGNQVMQAQFSTERVFVTPPLCELAEA